MRNILMYENELKKYLFKDTSSLREIVTVTNINKLVLPRIPYEIDGVEYRNEVKQELKIKGDMIHFTKNKFKLSVNIPDIINKADNNQFITYLKSVLKEGLAEKEKMCIFNTINSGEEHMNIYSSQNGIKEIEGENLFRAIKNSLADLDDKYRERASIVMSRRDYTDMIDKLSNFNSCINQSHQLFGIKVLFCKFAKKPVIGDFSQLHINYGDDILFEEGIDKIVVSGNFDIRVKLASAFRIAKVTS